MNVEYFKENKICIMIHGNLDYSDDIIKNYSEYKENVVISTNNSKDSDIKLLEENGFTVVVNELAKHSGRLNFNNQVINTFSGSLKAKEKGFKYVFKIRSDIFISDLNELIKSFNKDLFYFPAYHNHDGGYLCEHMLFGKTDDMVKLWDIPLSTSTLPPETQLTHNFYKVLNIDYGYIFPILYEKNIIAYWKKYNKNLNEYKYDRLFTYDKK